MSKPKEPRPPRGRSDLVNAVKRGDLDQITTIIDGATDLARAELLAQGLTVACEQKQLAVVQKLTSLGADPSASFASKPIPLLIAIDSDEIELSRHLLDHDIHHANPKILNGVRRAAMLTARSRAVANEILQRGLDLHSLGKEKQNLLMEIKHAEVVSFLLDQGSQSPNLEDTDELGRTALMYSLEHNDDPAVAKTLIERGADIEAKDLEGRSILTTAIWKSRIEVLQLLTDSKRNVQIRSCDKRQRNALHHLATDKRRNYEYQPERQTGSRKTQQDRDRQIIDILLRAGIDPDARDHRERTCVHWAAATGNSGLLKTLLMTKRFDINAVEHRGKTALHLAAASSYTIKKPVKGPTVKIPGAKAPAAKGSAAAGSAAKGPAAKEPTLTEQVPNGHFNAMLVLLDHGADVAVQADGNWTPLHNACWNEADTSATVGVLLRHSSGRGRHSKTRNGRTPLHIAAQAGNLGVVRYLLRRKDTNRSVRDIFGNTPLMYAASLPKSQKRDAMMGLFAPWNNVEALSSEARKASTLFHATVVDFAAAEPAADKNSTSERPKSKSKTAEKDKPVKHGGHAPMRVSMFDLLYNPDKAKKYASLIEPGQERSFRWLHLPANNVSWCLDLITNHFIASRGDDVGSFKALERSFNHQHRGEQLHSNYMTPLCQTVLRTDEEPNSGWDAENEMHRGMSQESDSFERNRMTPLSTTSDPSVYGFNSNVITKEPYSLPQWSAGAREPALAAQAQRQAAKTTRYRDGGTISDAYLFMPYLYYELQEHREKMGEMHKRWRFRCELDQALASPQRKGEPPPGKDRHDLLFDAHSHTPEGLLHVRRTLDQFFYHNIDTEKRDNDQVLHRYQGVVQKIDDPLHKVLMVDQLWMWVLGNDLVITSFPQRDTPRFRDPLDIHENILAILNSGGGEQVRNVFELAMVIVGRCYGAYDRHGLGSHEPQFLDMYEGWIGAVMDDEVQLFEQFKEDSESASKWLGNPSSLKEMRREQAKADKEARRKGVEQEISQQRQFTVLSSREEINKQRRNFVENLLDIGSETALLGESKDILDELHMLSVVFEHQLQVLPSMESAMKEIWHQERWSIATKRRIEKIFDDHRRTITYPQTDVDRMEKQARRIYKSITNLLDLKQKHANAIEARYAREQTDGASRQGQTFMVFTTVTVIFLPLSFLAAFFAIDIGEFPHTGPQTELSLAFVSKYTFGLGLSVAVVCVLAAIYAEDVAYHSHDVIKKALDRVRHTTTEAEQIARTRWQQRKQGSEVASLRSSQEKAALYEDLYRAKHRRSRASLPFRRRSARSADLEDGAAA